MSKGTTVQVLDRGLDIIEELAASEKGMSIAELSLATGLPKPTVHRILSTFLERHYVEKDPETAIYKMGNIFVEMASIYLNKIVLKTEAEPIMHRLAADFNKTSFLGIREGMDVVYLSCVEPVNSIRMYKAIGKREPLYCTALGKILLSAMPEDEFVHLAKQFTYKAYTARTIRGFEELAAEISEVRRCGYAMDKGEHTEASSCFAVPVYDYTRQIIAAMSISGFGLLENYSIDTIFNEMKSASNELCRRMGYKLPGAETINQKTEGEKS